ncbi:MAG: lysophospholipid acyltransferase family protein [Planctomycetota bacterium]|jgi:1-acyl-sn-glycerol-3-phosphate acyltransferase
MKRKRDNPLIDRIARALLFPYLEAAHRLRWSGVENMPASGPAILAANHQSFLDPVLIGFAADRRVVYLGWEYYYNWPILGPLMRLFGTVPVDVDAPAPTALARMLESLKRGRLCGIFPEGGRTRDGLIGRPKAGVVLLALRSRAPVVPVTITGAYRAWPPGQLLPAPAPIWLHFGRPFRISEPRGGEVGPDFRRRAALDVMLRVAEGFADLGRPDLADAARRKLLAQSPRAGG